MSNHKKILIVRNDKLGDFVLALPSFALLRKQLPDCEIHAFIPTYTKDIALISGFIDKVIIDPGSSASFRQQINTLLNIKKQNYDAVITLFSTTRVGVFSFLSGIKYRLAPATKVAQLFYNHRFTQRRSQSLKPEYEYNLDLAKKYLGDLGLTVKDLPKTPFLEFQENEINEVRAHFCKKYNLDINEKLIFIHPGTGGSATNLNLQQFATLAKNLKIDDSYTFVITAGPGEIEQANKLSQLLSDTSHIVYPSIEGLINFSKIIQLCNIFISGSTGPLHIAGALDRPTAAFYQRRRSATPLRWQTLNSENRRLAFTPPEDAGESDMSKIDIVSAAKEINEKLLKTN